MGRKRGRKPKTDKNYRKSPKGQLLRKGESYREDKGLYYFQYRDSLNRIFSIKWSRNIRMDSTLYFSIKCLQIS